MDRPRPLLLDPGEWEGVRDHGAAATLGAAQAAHAGQADQTVDGGPRAANAVNGDDAQLLNGLLAVQPPAAAESAPRRQPCTLPVSASQPALASWGSFGGGPFSRQRLRRISTLARASSFHHLDSNDSNDQQGSQEARRVTDGVNPQGVGQGESEAVSQGGGAERPECDSPVGIDPNSWASAPLFIPIVLQVRLE